MRLTMGKATLLLALAYTVMTVLTGFGILKQAALAFLGH